MFLALNVDIVRQFEFVQQQWINFGNDLEQGDDMDPLIGPNDGKTSKMLIPKDAETGTPAIECRKLERFVTPRGGDYFFLPGIAAFHCIVEGHFLQPN